MADLNERQRRFIEYYMTGISGAAAARKAQYSKNNAGHIACDLLKNPDVIAEIDRIRNLSSITAKYNYEAAMAEADECVRFAKLTENANAMVKAVELKTKLTGLLVEKHEVKHSGFSISFVGIAPPRSVIENSNQLESSNPNILDATVVKESDVTETGS